MSKIATTSYSVRVDYSPLTEMIGTGEYDWVDNDITQEHFPQPQGEVKEVDLVLVHLNKWASTEEAEAEIKKQGLRPADLAELLAFGAKYPDVQRQFSIVAFGSVWAFPRGCRFVPYLYGYWRGGRGLGLGWYGRDWHGCWRFLAARA